MIVVDVNLLVYLWIPGEQTGWAERVLEKDAQWVSSTLWRSEFRNVLAGYFRRGDMDRAAMNRCLAGAENQLSGCEYVVPSSWVMDKVEDSNCSAYDCEYVALAEDLGTVLVTADKKIIRAFPEVSIGLKQFVSV